MADVAELDRLSELPAQTCVGLALAVMAEGELPQILTEDEDAAVVPHPLIALSV